MFDARRAPIAMGRRLEAAWPLGAEMLDIVRGDIRSGRGQRVVDKAVRAAACAARSGTRASEQLEQQRHPCGVIDDLAQNDGNAVTERRRSFVRAPPPDDVMRRRRKREAQCSCSSGCRLRLCDRWVRRHLRQVVGRDGAVLCPRIDITLSGTAAEEVSERRARVDRPRSTIVARAAWPPESSRRSSTGSRRARASSSKVSLKAATRSSIGQAELSRRTVLLLAQRRRSPTCDGRQAGAARWPGDEPRPTIRSLRGRACLAPRAGPRTRTEASRPCP